MSNYRFRVSPKDSRIESMLGGVRIKAFVVQRSLGTGNVWWPVAHFKTKAEAETYVAKRLLLGDKEYV